MSAQTEPSAGSSLTPNRAEPAPARAYAHMLAAMVGFSVMALLIRLASAELPPLQIVFFRNFFALLLFLPLLLRRGLGFLRSPQLGLHLLRGVNGLAAMTCYFTALAFAPLAEVTALGFAMPLFATLGAAAFLGEQLRWRRMLALAMGFVGVLIVLWPKLGAPTLGAGLALGAAALIGSAVVMVKKLTATDSPAQIAIWMVLVQTPIALVPALYVWVAPSWTALGLMLGVAAAGSLAHLSWTRASSLAEVGMLQPIEFVRLPLVAALAFMLFDETPTAWTWAGGAAIFAATSYIAWRENRIATQAARETAAAARQSAGGPLRSLSS